MGYFDRLRAFAGGEQSGGGPKRSELETNLIRELQDLMKSDDAPETARYHLRFSGLVQGVGFRWTNQGSANDLKLDGWVRNLRDGSVALELQGPPQKIIAHLDAVHAYYDRMGCRMWLEEAVRVPVEESRGFNVRF